MKTGMEWIQEERARLEAAGLVETQVDIAQRGELAGGAACYALSAADYFGEGRMIVAGIWPLKDELLELEEDDVTRLARAGAMIAMEIERRQRVAALAREAIEKSEKRIITLDGRK